MNSTWITLLLTCLIVGGKCAKILGIFHVPSRSHCYLGKFILQVLAKRGHDVTILSPFWENDSQKNYESIQLSGLLEYREGVMMPEMAKIQEEWFFTSLISHLKHIQEINRIFLESSTLKTFLASNRSYDLIIHDWLFNPAFLGIADHFKAPLIVFNTIGASPMTNKVNGNPAPYSYVPNVNLPYSDEMTLLERTINTVYYISQEIFEEVIYYRMQESLLHKHFPKAPPLQDLMENISLVLLNSHFTVESPRPFLPGSIQIAGFHIKEKNTTGKFKDFLDNANDGVLYFSFGGNVKTYHLSLEKLQMIINTLSKLKLRCLVKLDSEYDSELPDNIMVEKWFPQNDILAHPNVKVFITHGGKLSITEAVYHGVPMIGLPFFADQGYNIAHCVQKGFAVSVSLKELTEEKLAAAIDQILHNPRYKETIRSYSLSLRNPLVQPLDKAIYWIEYVLKHKGAPHLKTRALKLRWYQYLLVDVFLLLGISGYLCLVSVYLVIQIIRKIISRKFAANSDTGMKYDGKTE